MTGDEQVDRLIREHAPDARGDYLKQFTNMFDEDGKVYAACVRELEKPRRDEIRNRGGFIFTFLRGIENAGGYESWVAGRAPTQKPQARELDVDKVLADLRRNWRNYIDGYTDDEIRDEIAKTAHMADHDFVFGTRASCVANALSVRRMRAIA